MGSISQDDPDTWVDEVLDVDDDDDDDDDRKWTELAFLLDRSVSRSETFVGFEIPLAEMWCTGNRTKVAAG
ncbi:MAG TPA: hypothetical protein VNO21_09510 [Polyangiaceae bacterium]|nr:hypothetical protein [Polyangiaceae bacterium]